MADRTVRVTMAVTGAAKDVLPQVMDGESALIMVGADTGTLSLTAGNGEDMVELVGCAVRWLRNNYGDEAAHEAIERSRRLAPFHVQQIIRDL